MKEITLRESTFPRWGSTFPHWDPRLNSVLLFYVCDPVSTSDTLCWLGLLAPEEARGQLGCPIVPEGQTPHPPRPHPSFVSDSAPVLQSHGQGVAGVTRSCVRTWYPSLSCPVFMSRENQQGRCLSTQALSVSQSPQSCPGTMLRGHCAPRTPCSVDIAPCSLGKSTCRYSGFTWTVSGKFLSQ